MTISAQTLAFEYAANGVTTTFPYGFRVLYADQVKVYVNGTLQVGGYTLTGVGDAGGGNVIFSVAPVNGATVLVRRISDRVRSTDFQQSPYFTQEELLDQDQDYQTMLLQEAAADATNSLRIPAIETTTTQLPDAATRANKAVVFDALGNATVSNDNYEDQAAAASASAAAALASKNAAAASAIAAEASADRVDLGALDAAVAATAADRVQTGLDAAATAADRVQTGLDATATDADRIAAHAARDAALLSRGVFASTADALSKGVASLASLVAGSGGTNGTFDLAFSGGAGTGAAGVFVVAGGAVVSTVITATGRGYTSAPTVSFAASSGLTGASATAVIANNADVGEYFSTPVVDAFLQLYVVKAGPVATAVGDPYPTTAIVAQEIIDRKSLIENLAGGLSGIVAGIKDAVGNFAMFRKDDGKWYFDGPLVASRFIGRLMPPNTTSYITGSQDKSGVAFASSDGDDNIGMQLGSTGVFRVRRLIADSVESRLNYSLPTAIRDSLDIGLYDVQHWISYGQSLAKGFNAIPAIGTTQNYGALMFNGGINTTQPANSNTNYTASELVANHASLVPLVEATYESPISGGLDFIAKLMLDENGIDITTAMQFLGSAPASGATTIANLSKGTTPYNNLISDVTYGVNLLSPNKASVVRGVTWLQGEANQGAASPTYLNPFKQLWTDLNTDIKAVTGQSQDIVIFSGQVASESSTLPSVAYQQLQASLDLPGKIVLVCPQYFFDYQDGQHLKGFSSRWIAAYFGLAYKRVIMDGQTWTGVQPNAHRIAGNTLVVQFDVPVRPLVLDTNRVALASNYGFTLWQSDGVTAVTIDSVSLAGPDRVRIVAATTITAGMILRYASTYAAFNGNGEVGTQMRIIGSRGNLRDSQGGTPSRDGIVFSDGIRKYPMHNWCFKFERTL